ncbi:hypothetical protein NDN08_008022 [Rhodosorus marinus]|uniref:Kinesin light chain n=1 Tax=Rhodosorus marinus TaxID=101924 RepID=A0AAV8UZJ4_9RHOD|nr:hypothetical protein NDN08_008022 [Rhodosorus marinus]
MWEGKDVLAEDKDFFQTLYQVLIVMALSLIMSRTSRLGVLFGRGLFSNLHGAGFEAGVSSTRFLQGRSLSASTSDSYSWEQDHRRAWQQANKPSKRSGKNREQDLETLIMDFKQKYVEGKYREAKLLGEKCVLVSKDLRGLSDPVTASTLNNLAIILKRLGNLHYAEKVYSEAISIYNSIYGPTHQNTMTAISNRALLMRRLGKSQEALEDLELVHKYRHEEEGVNSPATAIALSNVATSFRQMGLPEKALKMYKNALEVLREQVGEDDLGTATVLNDMSLTLVDLSKLAEAEEVCGKAIAVRSTVLGRDHPDTVRSMENMITIFAKQDEQKGQVEKK